MRRHHGAKKCAARSFETAFGRLRMTEGGRVDNQHVGMDVRIAGLVLLALLTGATLWNAWESHQANHIAEMSILELVGKACGEGKSVPQIAPDEQNDQNDRPSWRGDHL
jgi:hypothetical protein